MFKISESDDKEHSLYLFRPNMFQLFYRNEYPFERSIKQIVRFMLEFLRAHYKVYYLVDKNMNMCGMCAVQLCGHGRYSFFEKDSYMIGPYAVNKEFRGKGFSTKMLKMVLAELPLDAVLYDWISKDNTASRAATEKMGFVPINGMKLTSVMRRFMLGDIEYGDYLIYKTENKYGKKSI